VYRRLWNPKFNGEVGNPPFILIGQSARLAVTDANPTKAMKELLHGRIIECRPALGRAKAFPIENLRDLRRAVTCVMKLKDPGSELFEVPQLFISSDRADDFALADEAPSPVNRDVDVFRIVRDGDDDMVHDMSNYLLALLERAGGPQCRNFARERPHTFTIVLGY
jgi:hypothetical protein